MNIRKRMMWLGVVALVVLSCAQAPTGPLDNTWRLFPGRVEAFSFAPFRDGRQCWAYLPPGYGMSGNRYPVLYVHDGEWQFDGWGKMHLNRICESLIRRGEMEAVIVIAIDSQGSAQRFRDYIPQIGGAGDSGADAFLRAIRDTLKPEVDKRYRTLADPSNTAMSGLSLGGLLSTYAAYAFDSTFGKAGSFSPSYGPGFLSYASARGRPRGFELFYQDTGTEGDNDIGSMERIAIDQGFQLGVDFMSLTVEGATHTFAAWEHRYPDMLKFLFPPKG